MKDWLSLAFSGPVRRRALRIMVVVGAILITINHGDAILRGAVDGARFARILLTLAVPYVVSTVSSVAAMRQMREEELRKKDGG